MQKKIILFNAIFLITFVICLLSLWVAAVIDEDMVESKVVIVLGTFFFNIVRFPFLLFARILNERFLYGNWFLLEFFLDILFYTIIIYKLYIWIKNKRKAKEE